MFPNAFTGVKKLFTSAVLTIISTIAAIITIAAGFTTGVAAAEGSGTGALASLGIAAIMGIATAVLALIAFILNITGAKKASADEPLFKNALIAIFISFVASVVGGFFSSNKTVSGITSTVNSICSFLIMYYIITAIISLSGKLGNTDMQNKGKSAIRILTISYILDIILEIVSNFILKSDAVLVIAGVLGIVALVFTIVITIIYMSYLSKAKYMLISATAPADVPPIQ